MSSELQEKLKTLKNCSAWEFDEVLVLLTGVTSTQIEYLEPRVHPPVLDIRYVLMLETREITWPAGSETVGGHAIYGKGDVVPVNKKQAKHFISNGWAEDSESSAERKNRIKKEENQYQQARDQSTLMEMLERAILDRDIKSLNDVDTYPREKWRLNKTSVLQWIDINKVTVFQLRHFPNNIDDILDNELQLFKETRPTTGKTGVPRIAGPYTKRTKTNALRRKFYSIAKKLSQPKGKLKVKPSLKSILSDTDWKYALEDSGLSNEEHPAKGTLSNWLCLFNNGTPPPKN